jgi:hypothetical protein
MPERKERPLDEHEIEMLRLRTEGLSAKKIAAQMNLGYDHVERFLTTNRARKFIDGQTQKAAEKFYEETGVKKKDLLHALWRIATTPAQDTKGSLATQRDAINDLWEKMGYQNAKPEGEGEVDQEPQVYEPAWMRKAEPIQ